MTWKRYRYVGLIGATAMIALGVITIGTFTATAATPQCGSRCISIFSHQLGTYTQPNVVEAVLDGVAKVGQPVILKKADNSDPSEDLLGLGGSVSDFYAKGLISAAANDRFAGLQAAQIEYAPYGNGTGLCVGLADAPYENEGLTLQPCTVLEGRTVWVIDGPDSPATAPAFFPIVNAATA